MTAGGGKHDFGSGQMRGPVRGCFERLHQGFSWPSARGRLVACSVLRGTNDPTCKPRSWARCSAFMVSEFQPQKRVLILAVLKNGPSHSGTGSQGSPSVRFRTTRLFLEALVRPLKPIRFPADTGGFSTSQWLASSSVQGGW